MSGDPTDEAPLVPGRQRISRNVGFAFVVSLVSAGCTAVLTLFLLRALGPKSYGVFALATGVGALALLPSNLGISSAASRFVAESRHDRAAVRGLVSDALRLKVAAGLVFAIALIACAQPIADAYDTPALVWPIRWMALAIFGQGLLQLYDELLETEGKVSVYLRIVGVESVLETVGSVALVVGGLGASGAVAGKAGAFVFAAVMGAGLLFRTLGFRPSLIGPSHGNIRRIMGYGSALLIVDGTFTLFSQVDVLLIGAVISVTAVGQFQAPVRIITLLSYAGAAVAAGVAPRVARSLEGSNTQAFDMALRRLMALQGLFMAPLLVWAEPITRVVLGSGYTSSAAVLRGMAPYAFLIAIAPLVSRGVTYLGEARRRIPVAVVALLVNLGLDLLLLPRVGVVGGAIGTDVGYTIYVGGHLWICRSLLGTELRPLAVTLVRVALGVGVASAVLLALGTGDVSIPVLVLGGALCSLAYLGVLRLSGEITGADVKLARERAQGILRRG